MTLFLLILFLSSMRADGCHSDRNKDHRPRVSCVGMSLSSVPAGIEPNTEVLVLSQNLFASLNWGTYVGFPLLHELDLTQNSISGLDCSGSADVNLSVLHLSNNLLVGVGERAFVCAPKLRELYLRRNRLRSLHGSSFSGLPLLEVLDLSSNHLTVLPPDLLVQISSTALKTLDLEDNRISLMPDKWFESKPELPYVFLSRNPWACFCNVGYLQVYLDDQAHNVYIHTKPDSANPIQDIENNVDNVVCASPTSLATRPVVDLTEDEYCDPTLPSEAPAPPVGYGDTYTSMDISSHATKVNPWTTTTATTTTKRITTTPAPTTIDLGPKSSATTTSTAQTTSAVDPRTTASPTTMTSATADTIFQPTNQSIFQYATTPVTTLATVTTPASILASTLQGAIMMWTRRWMVSWTIRHAWTETWMSSSNQSSWWSLFTTSYPITYSELTTFTWPTTLLPDTSISSEDPTTTSPTTTTQHLTAGPTFTNIDWSHGGAGARMWCTWLFVGLLLLCLLCALSSCLLALGLLWIYFTLYQPLAKRVANAANAHTHLLDHHVNHNLDGLSGMGPPYVDSSGGVQATFRSVLFIAKGSEGGEEEETLKGEKKDEEEQGGEKDENREGEQAEALPFISTELGITDVETGVVVVKQRNQREGEIRGGVESQEIFRKTLYRVFSREEEIEGWREMEEHWEGECGTKEGGEQNSRKRRSVMGGADVERKTRYSLILREEKTEGNCGAEERGLEWLVGEWEMGGMGVNMNEGWASLINERPLIKASPPKEDM